MIQTLPFIINVAPEGVPQIVRLSQNENGRNLAFTLTGAGTLSIPSGSTVTLSGTKPDGVVYSATGSLSGNVATFAETTQMTAVSGIWPAKIKVTYSGETIATCKIVFAIDPDPVAPGSVPSNSQLNGLVAEAQQYATYAKYEAFGSPLVAATAAAMTDHSRVYVYTGSETGKTAGHWYYWNGSAWTDGGVYNSQGINTDTTLSISGMAADAKATGDEFTSVKADLTQSKDNALTLAQCDDINISALGFFEQGGISTVYGTNYNPQTWRVRSIGIIVAPYTMDIYTKSGYVLSVWLFENGAFDSYVGGNITRMTLAEGTQYRLVIAKSPETTSGSANVTEFVDSVRIDGTYVSKIESNFSTVFDTINRGWFSIKTIAEFINAGLAGITPYYPQTWRVSMYPYITADRDMIIRVKNGYKMGFRNVINGEHDASGSSDYTAGKIKLVSKGQSFAMVILKDPETASGTANIDEFTNAIQVTYALEQNKKAPNIKFVAHQGYSYTYEYGRSIAQNYINAGKVGFDGAECDVRFTSDNVPVCCHDATFIDSDDGTTVVVVADHTYTELQEYGYYGSKISSLDEVVRKSKEAGLDEIIFDQLGTFSDVQWNAIFAIVKKYQIADKVRWVVGFNDTVIAKILSFDAKPVFVAIASNNTDLQSAVTAANALAVNGVKYYIACNHVNITKDQIITASQNASLNVSLLAYTIDNIEKAKEYMPYVTHIISDKVTYQMLGVFDD